MNAAENSDHEISYAFADHTIDIFNTNYYYRLKITNLDGTISYSSTEHIDLPANESTIVYPTTFRNNLTIQMESLTAAYKIYNCLGDVVKEGSIEGNHSMISGLDNLSSGHYQLVVITDQTTKTFKLIKD